MKIGKKLLGGFSIVLLLLVVAGAVAFFMFESVKGATMETNNDKDLATFLTAKVGDHLKWIGGLGDMFIGGKEFEGELDYHKCGLGQWYYCMRILP